MYAGHIGIALGAKGIRGSIPLWVLVFATQLPDWADAGLCLAGIRTSVPGIYSHSLPAIAALAVLAALVYYAGVRDGGGVAIVACVVITHMVADYVTGHKPLWPGGPVIGLDLYSYPRADFLLESFVICCGWLLYRQSLPNPRRRALAVNLIPAALVLFQLAAAIAFSVAPPLEKC